MQNQLSIEYPPEIIDDEGKIKHARTKADEFWGHALAWGSEVIRIQTSLKNSKEVVNPVHLPNSRLESSKAKSKDQKQSSSKANIKDQTNGRSNTKKSTTKGVGEFVSNWLGIGQNTSS